MNSALFPKILLSSDGAHNFTGFRIWDKAKLNLCKLPIDMVLNLVQTDKNQTLRFQPGTLFFKPVPC